MILDQADSFEAGGTERGVATEQPGADDELPLVRQ
jgi:hypothetical protein